jgi:hypothetical protein
VLAWSCAGQLAADEYFDVRVWKSGSPALGIANIRGFSYSIGGDFPAGDYNWTIVVIRRQGAVVKDVAAASVVGQFTWNGSPGSSGSGSRPKGR